MKLKEKKVVKVLFGGAKGVTVNYTGKRPKGVPEKGSFTIGADPFDTLKDAVAKLKRHFLKVCGLNSVSLMTDSDALVRKMNDKEIKAFEKATATAQAKNVNITGLTIGYDEEGKLKHTKLLAMYANEKGETFSINAPLVHLDREDYYGIETDLQRDILALLTEVEAFDNGDYDILEEPENNEEDPGDEQPEEEEKTEDATPEEVSFDDDEPAKKDPAKMTVAKKAAPTKHKKAA